MGDAQAFDFTVTGHEVFQERSKTDYGLASGSHLRLRLQGPQSPASRPVTLAIIYFSEQPITPSQGIGTINKNSPPSGDDTLIAFLPVADFENYWKILTTTQQPHLRLITPVGGGTSLDGLTLASGGFPPDEGIF